MIPLEERRYKRNCLVCGKEFENTYATKQQKYCNDCRDEARLQKSRERSVEYRIRQKHKQNQDRIAHQQDRSIWTPDYAERQKQKTLAMIGRVEV